jgi:hypothetical protein
MEELMIPEQLLAFTLLAITTPAAAQPRLLSTNNYSVVAWYCDGKACSSTPRRLGDAIPLSEDAWRAELARIENLPEKWSVVFNCAVHGSRFGRCQLEDDTLASEKGRAVASQLVRGLRFEKRNGRVPPTWRALVSIDYAPGFCPRCPAIPPPAPLPAG